MNWPELDLWSKLAEIFKTNIIIITIDQFSDPHIYKTEKIYDTINVIYNHSGIFDTLAQKDGAGNLMTSFKRDDITINALQ